MMKTVYLFAAFLLTVCSIQAQKFSASINAQLGIPQGEYNDVAPDAGIGGRFNFLFRPKESAPLKVGLELGIMQKGSRSQYFNGYVFGFYEEYKVSGSNQVFSLTFMPRIQSAKQKFLNPFIDGIMGWNVFFSTVSVERLGYSSDPYYDDGYSNSTKGNWAFTYGGAAGVDISLDKNAGIGLELKCAYLRGAETRYLINPQITSNGDVHFTEVQSETNMVIPQIGVRINIK